MLIHTNRCIQARRPRLLARDAADHRNGEGPGAGKRDSTELDARRDGAGEGHGGAAGGANAKP